MSASGAGIMARLKTTIASRQSCQAGPSGGLLNTASPRTATLPLTLQDLQQLDWYTFVDADSDLKNTRNTFN